MRNALAFAVVASALIVVAAGALIITRSPVMTATLFPTKTVTVTKTVTSPFTLYTTLTTTATETTERTRTITVTSTITVAPPSREKTVTVTKLATLTRTVTATEAHTVTVTATKTVTETVTVAPLPAPSTSGSSSAGSSLYYSEPPPPPPPPPGAPGIGPVKVYTADGLLVVKRIDGYHGVLSLEYTVARRGSTVLTLTAPGVAEEGLASVFFNASREGVVIAWDEASVAEKLGPGVYEFNIYGAEGKGWSCILESEPPLLAVRSCTEMNYITAPIPVAPGTGSYDTIASAIVLGINETSLAAVKAALYGSTRATGPWAAWEALMWTEQNTQYDYAKMKLLGSGVEVGVYGPLGFLKKRSGVCSDYAVFLAAATLSQGLDSYIILFPRAMHAAAAVALNRTLFVLDQRLPPIELQDYLQYVDPLETRLVIYHLHLAGAGVYVVGYTLSTRSVIDRFPTDHLTKAEEERVVEKLSATTGMEENPALLTVLETGLGGAFTAYSLPRLPGLAVEQPPVPLDRAYSPVFAEQWATWLASKAAEMIRTYFPSAMGGSFALLVSDSSNATRVEVYAVKQRGFHVSTSLAAPYLYIKLSTSEPITSPETQVVLNLYRREGGNTTLCGMIVPPGYTSPLPHIVAHKWIAASNTVLIEVDMARLLDLVSTSCGGKAYLGVWLRDNLIYVLHVKAK